MSAAGNNAETVLHAVAVGEHALLISGAGKTTLALEMVPLGADLIADDRVLARPGSDGRL